jgi:hypothetical protein
LLAVVFEERDLIAHFGRRYEEYRRQVPMFVPWRGTALPADADRFVDRGSGDSERSRQASSPSVR